MAKRTVRPRPKSKAKFQPKPLAAAPPQTAFALPSADLERGLITGESQGLLEDYFGAAAWQQLHDLSLHATTAVRGGPRVLILPGIMGSTLARKGPLGLHDILWINPAEIALGRLAQLKLGAAASPYFASGVFLPSYLKLKLRLKIAGFDADFFPYDWRYSTADLGASLAATLRDDPAGEIYLVAHSMGGLVARAALATPAGAKVKRLIMLGTPNYGSFAILQALRGTLDVVKKLAEVDLLHKTPELADIFSSFPGLYEMLPAPSKFESLNLYDANIWPTGGQRPRPERLSAVGKAVAGLAPADSRFYLIAGVNQQTYTGAQIKDGEFAFTHSPEGDGTVPLAFARLDGLPPGQTYYVEEQHGSLPNNAAVESAVLDLLATGTTRALATTPTAMARSAIPAAAVPERALRAAPPPAVSGSARYRHLIDEFAAPIEPAAAAIPEPALAAAATATAPGEVTTLQNLVIGRRRQRRLEITLANGSLTEADSEAYVLGVFAGVAPSGAAKALDELLEGAISEFTARRIFSGQVGELFTLPAARSRLAANLIVFAGLGAFDRFNPDVHTLVAENIIRMLARSHIQEFATVLIGAGAGQSIPAVVRNLFTGFLRGLNDADPRHHFRGITLCETDPGRFAQLKSTLLTIAGSSMFDDVELTLDEVSLPPPAAARATAALAPGPEPVYVMIRQESADAKTVNFRISVLGSGMKAAVVSLPQRVETAKLNALLGAFDAVAGRGPVWNVAEFGARFGELMMPEGVRAVLSADPARHLVFVHDAAASRIPWETLAIGQWVPSVAGGVSRRYLADNLPITTWLEQRRVDPSLHLLLIVDPTQNLPGAAKEGDRILRLAGTIDRLEVTELRGERATKPAVLAALRSGKFDIVHYAGHAFFDAAAPGKAGLLLAGREPLNGPDLAGMSNLPFLIFFNACQAGRVRGTKASAADIAPASRIAERSYSVAETLMRGGVSNYLSTYWPVQDDAADSFAGEFYKSVLAGCPVGAALLDGRRAVQKLGAQDWADYILYGSYDFILKRRT